MSSRWRVRLVYVLGAIVLLTLSINLFIRANQMVDISQLSLENFENYKHMEHLEHLENPDEVNHSTSNSGIAHKADDQYKESAKYDHDLNSEADINDYTDIGNHIKPPGVPSLLGNDSPENTESSSSSSSSETISNPKKDTFTTWSDATSMEKEQSYLQDARDKILKSHVGKLYDPPVWSSSDIRNPLGREVVVLTLKGSGEQFRNSEVLLKTSVDNKQDFCNRHKYDFGAIDYETYKRDLPASTSDVGWSKPPILRSALTYYPEAQWFWWLEEDSLIMNKGIDLAKYVLDNETLATRITYDIPISNWQGQLDPRYIYPSAEEIDVNDIDIILPHGEDGIKLNSFFIRRSEFTRELLDKWEAPRINKHFAGQETEALTRLILSDGGKFLKHVALVPERLFMSRVNAEDSHLGKYHVGDFVADLSSLNEQLLETQWKTFLDWVVD